MSWRRETWKKIPLRMISRRHSIGALCGIMQAGQEATTTTLVAAVRVGRERFENGPRSRAPCLVQVLIEISIPGVLHDRLQHFIMKLSAAFGILLDLRFAILAAFMPTIRAVIKSPSLLLQPRALSRTFMAKLWALIGNGVDENGRVVKQHLINPNAYGIVLDLGAGKSVSQQHIISPHDNKPLKVMDTRLSI